MRFMKRFITPGLRLLPGGMWAPRAAALAWSTAGVLALLMSADAHAQQAQQAVTNNTVDLRAGPSPDYPLVTQLPAGVQLAVAGCTDAYQWCDVLLADGLRGWVYAQGLSYVQQGQSLVLSQYGPSLGIPLLVFNVGSYWGSHYQNRPFYNEPRHWGGRHPPRHGQHLPVPSQTPSPPSYIGQAPGIVSPTTGIVGGPPPGVTGPPPGVAGNRPPGVVAVPPQQPPGQVGLPPGSRQDYGERYPRQPGVQPAPMGPAFNPQPVGPPRRFQ
ncbi:MAG: type 3 domain protein [Polaromonas sp.]|nr:type 3 domain protein [Polaromonas sp.]